MKTFKSFFFLILFFLTLNSLLTEAKEGKQYLKLLIEFTILLIEGNSLSDMATKIVKVAIKISGLLEFNSTSNEKETIPIIAKVSK